MFEEEVPEGTKSFLAFQASSTEPFLSFLVGAEFVTLHPAEQVFDALMTWELIGQFAVSDLSLKFFQQSDWSIKRRDISKRFRRERTRARNLFALFRPVTVRPSYNMGKWDYEEAGDNLSQNHGLIRRAVHRAQLGKLIRHLNF
jgi:hypothetical protein